MGETENSSDDFVDVFYPIIKDFIDYDDFKEIYEEFSKYEDIDRKAIPFSVCEMILACRRLGFKDSLVSSLQLILLTSIIELLKSRKEYVSFDSWYNLNKKMIENWKCVRSWLKYKSEYGARKNVRNFFLGLSKKEKISILTKLTKKYDEEVFAPFCYQSRDDCYYRHKLYTWEEGRMVEKTFRYSFECNAIESPEECLALKNKKILDMGIKDFANHLYDLRDYFVHESRLPYFSFPPPSLAESGKVVRTYYGYHLKKKNCGRNIGELDLFVSYLTVKDLFDLVGNNLEKLFKKYLQEVVGLPSSSSEVS